VLVYAYIDIVSPQRLTYVLLNSVPISLIAVGLACSAGIAMDDKKATRVAPRQLMIARAARLLLLHHAQRRLQSRRAAINGIGCGRRWPSPPSCR
jgi:hypothetical protein